MKKGIAVLSLLAVLGPFPGPARPSSAAAHPASQPARLSDQDLDTVVTYIVQAIIKDPSTVAFDTEVIEKETGVTIPDAEPRIQSAVIDRLKSTEEGRKALAKLTGGMSCAEGGERGGSCTPAGASRCTEYQACSLYGDLSGATEKTLEMYTRERAEDGTTFDHRPLPAFDGTTLEGNPVTSADLAGKPTLLVFLAGHCGHSIATLGILQTVADAFADRNLQVVGVFVNSGSGEQVGKLADMYKVTYPIWLHPDTGIGDVIHSHLVPTFFFVDAKGDMEEKLVGMKTQDQVRNFVAAHLTAPEHGE